MNNIISILKIKIKDCRDCACFVASRLTFVVILGCVLGSVGSQSLTLYPGTVLLNEVKASSFDVVLAQPQDLKVIK